jgi:hypothetical protein
MNRFTSAIAFVLVSSAASAAALAADETSSAAAPVAVAATATQATSTTPAAKAVPTRVSATSAPAGDRSVQRLVCLNMSLQCFAMKPKADDAPARTQSAALDLKAPDIRRVVPEVELRAPPDEPVEIDEQQVQVEGARPEVYVPGGIASLPWAVMHPTQAWRILLPVPPGVAK